MIGVIRDTFGLAGFGGCLFALAGVSCTAVSVLFLLAVSVSAAILLAKKARI